MSLPHFLLTISIFWKYADIYNYNCYCILCRTDLRIYVHVKLKESLKNVATICLIKLASPYI